MGFQRVVIGLSEGYQKMFQIQKMSQIQNVSQIPKISQISKMSQIQKMSQITKMSQILKKISQIHKMSQIQKTSQIPKMSQIQKIPKFKKFLMERPERRRREGRRSVRFAFGRRSSLFCVPVLFLYLCLLWVYVFYGFYVGPAKLQRGATPPSVMVLFATE